MVTQDKQAYKKSLLVKAQLINTFLLLFVLIQP